MKKIGFLSVILAISFLAGCGSNKSAYVVPSTPYEKVKTAFSGVEKSMKNVSTGNKSNKQLRLLSKDSVLNSLFALYTSSDNLGDVIEDLSYTEPPMIQFQCLKYAFEKIGSGYTFDTKYYDTINGKVYIDFDTGIEAEHTSEYEYNYSFVLGLGINIDSNDLITADVSFSITLSKGSSTYQTDWYVNMSLDYNMDKESPTYTLTMLTNNDERGLPYYNRCVYEYDYVQVNDNKIIEWRKFDLEAPIELVRDNEHQTFDAYINSGVSYRVGAFAWYKNKSLYKAKNIDKEDRKVRVANLLFELGLNSTDINKEPFASKQGTRNSVIQSMYQEFSRLFKKDIIYSLVSHDDAEEEKPTYLQVVDSRTYAELSDADEAYLGDNRAPFSSLVTDSGVYLGQSSIIPKFNVLNKGRGVMREATIDDVELKVIVGDSEAISINVNDIVKNFIDERHITMFKLQVNLLHKNKAVDSKTLTINCAAISEAIQGWPFDILSSMGISSFVPSFTSKSIYATAEVVSQSTDPLGVSILINSLEENDISRYYEKLQSLGYAEVHKNPIYAFADTSRNMVFTIRFDGDYLKIEQTNDFKCSYSQLDKAIFSNLNQDVLLPEGLIFNHPNNIDETFDYYGVSSKTFDDFISKLKGYGWKESEDQYGQYKYYFDLDSVRYGINYEKLGDYSIRVVYLTTDVPIQRFTYAEIVLKDDSTFSMGPDADGNLFYVCGLMANEEIYLRGYIGYDFINPTTVNLTYKDLEMNDFANEYLSQGKDDRIRIVKEVTVKIAIISDMNGHKIVCSKYNEGGEEEEYIKEHDYSLVGEFNGWETYNGITLGFNNKTGYYYLDSYNFFNGQGFVIIEDGSWNNYFGFSHLDGDYSEYVVEGETNGIVPITNFTATIMFKDGVMSLTNIIPN